MKETPRSRAAVFLPTLLCCLLWGSAFPGIKLGYRFFSIDGADTKSILLFAGVRFLLAGLLVLLFLSIRAGRWPLPKRAELPKILLLSLFQTIGQYTLFYLGLSRTSGTNAAIIDSLTSFFAILAASLLFRMETLSLRKVLGCALGFFGVLLVNLDFGGAKDASAGLTGDLLIALSAACYAISSCLIKHYGKAHDPALFSGYQFLFGGLFMAVFGLTGNQRLSGPSFTPAGFLTLLYLALVSGVAYTLWSALLRTNDVSTISIFGFMNPVFGVILSALLLHETTGKSGFYLLALLFVSAGIILVNFVPKKEA